MEPLKQPLEQWDEDVVSKWLRSIGIKEEYIQKLHEEEVNGPVLKGIDVYFLTTMGMKRGQIHLLIAERDTLLDNLHSNTELHFHKPPLEVTQNKSSEGQKKKGKNKHSSAPKNVIKLTEKQANDFQNSDNTRLKNDLESHVVSQVDVKNHEDKTKDQNVQLQMTEDSDEKVKRATDPLTFAKFRTFGHDDNTFKYVKNTVLLLPETGIRDMINPCHEYKSFATAAQLEDRKLKSKFANEVIRFASACMNIRTNGTIHFGVMDSDEDKGYKHGQIVGVPVKNRALYVDALDLIENCFILELETVRHCIHPPRFIEVIERDTEEQCFIIEVDIEPLLNIVKGKIFPVRLAIFDHDSNKLTYSKQTIYNRVGANSVPIMADDQLAFFHGLHERDARREQAEKSKLAMNKELPEMLGRKLTILLTDGKKSMNDSLWYILVTNRCEKEDLQHINFLVRMKIFCVFDYDADSNLSGLCKKYKEHHALNLHSLESYSIESGMSTSEFKKHMCLFDQSSWIFCNGRNDYSGGDKPCDDNTWIKTKRKYLKKAVSLICGEILPKGSFLVLFLLLSPVGKPIVDTFHEFYTEMDNILCIAESREHYEVWATQAQASCPTEKLDKMSIVGMKLSHVDATVETMLPSTFLAKHLPIFTKGLCALSTVEEEKLCSLEILCTDECNDIKLDFLSQEKIQEIESTFYQGGKVSWNNFWLADQMICGEVIEREACREVQDILKDILHGRKMKFSTARIKIFHQPGSGGSTVARHVLCFPKDLRCAVVKTSYSFTTVSEHAVKFREYEEKDTRHCLPVLLLVEDCDEEYLDDLRHELADAMACKNVTTQWPCFIIMSCKRSNVPEKLCKASPLETVSVTHKLTDKEKRLFASKLTLLEQQFKPEFIITCVLMSKEFNEQYVKDFVEHLLQGIDHSSPVTCLMRYVALLNFYVQNSYISLSHCEAFLGMGTYTVDDKDRLGLYNFKNSLSEQARLIFIELRENTTGLSSIHIIHPLVANQILHQLSGSRHQSQIAMDLLEEKVLFQHRFGREEFIKLIKDLFLRRYRKSKGDNVDSFFSPLIEHVCNTEKNLEGAITLLKAAYERLGKDPFVAQQLARLHYTNGKFQGAQYWAEVAKSHLPRDSFILDTEGQVYKKWFAVTIDEKGNDVTAMEVTEIIEIALKAMECFRASEKAAKSESDCMNNSGYFGEVNVGCQLLQMLSTLEVFNRKKEREYAVKERSENTELIEYLNGNYIPEHIKEPWHKLHSRLKGLRQTIYNALEWISEDLSYFQTDKNDDEEQNNKEEDPICNPRKWLVRKSQVCARFFSLDFLSQKKNMTSESQASLTPLVRRMHIYKYGGGNFTTILALLSDSKDDRAARKLEEIINLYPSDPQKESLDEIDLINYILCHITLACLLPTSLKLMAFPKLRELSKSFFKKRKISLPASAHYLLTLLFWPDNTEDRESSPEKDDILISALQTLKRLYEIKIKNIPSRKKRIYTHFFLGKGNGLNRTVHKSKIEKLLSGPLNERRLRWLNGEVWKTDTVAKVLKRVEGWTEDRNVFVQGHCKMNKINILPLHFASVPPGKENVTFYLGFSFTGLVALDIQVTK